MTTRLIVVVLLTAPFIYCHKLITILSDFTNDKDIEFFKSTLPWVVDNVGSDINLKFHFKDSGINSGPRQCVLSQLRINTYLQADFLSCLAEGNSQAECITHLPLNMYHLNTCIRSNVKRLVKTAEREFRKFKVDVTPFLILPRRKIVTDVTPRNIIKSICALYPNKLPMKPIGCIVTSPLPGEKQKPDENTDSEESLPESTPSPEDKLITEHDQNSEDKTVPEEHTQPDENSTPESETKPEKHKQLDENSPPESKTNSEKQKQPDENSPPESKTNPEGQKQLDEKSSSESETKTDKQQQPDENHPQEKETKSEEQKQPDENPSPESEAKSEEQKRSDENSSPESEIKSEEQKPQN